MPGGPRKVVQAGFITAANLSFLTIGFVGVRFALWRCKEQCSRSSDFKTFVARASNMTSKVINLLERRARASGPTAVNVLPSPTCVASALRMRMCPGDRAFDRFLPHELRVVSSRYWTPLVVALRAAEWFDELNIRTLVDIGSGAGKFCVATALASRVHVTGVEQRLRLVSAAHDLARLFEADARVTFVHGTFGETVLPEADAYYMYNPFGENLFGPEDYLDNDVELSHARQLRDLAAVKQLLRDAPVGTCLLTYNGFGGEVPASYREIRVDRETPNVLRMWRKIRRANSGPPYASDAW